MKKALTLSNERMELIKNLNIRALYVTEMLEFYMAATTAKMIGISVYGNDGNITDPDIFKEEARKYARMYGDCFVHGYNSFFNNVGL